MKKRVFVVAAIIFSSQLHAQQDSSAISLNEVIMTSNKYPKKQSETGKVVTVISRAELDRSGGRTVSEILNTVVGTTVIGSNNVLGTNQTVSIRGASAGNVLILLDGIPVNDPSVISNYFDLNFLNPDQIERIEILKGGQSTLYGSDAVAGVINIISRKAGVKKINVNGHLSGGSYGTLRQSIGLNGNAGRTDYSLDYTHVNADGFSTATDANKTGLFDKDGYDQHLVNGRVGFSIVNNLKATIFSNYSVYKADLDASAFTDERDYRVTNRNVQTGAGLTYTYNKGAVRLNYSFNRVARGYVDDSSHISSIYSVYSKSDYVGRTQFAELYGTWKNSMVELLVGGDYRFNNTDQRYYSTGAFGPYAPPVLVAKMNQVSPYASLVIKPSATFNIEVGSRLNVHSEYGTNVTFTLNPSYMVNERVKLFANAYSAFKTPTLYQLFDMGAGNVDLLPEKGMTGEIGASVNWVAGLTTRIVGYYRSAKDAIVYTSDPVTYASKYLNVSEQKNYGVELEAAYTAGKWNASANYAYTDGETTSPFDGTGAPLGKDTTYFNLYRIPKHAVNVSVAYQATSKLMVSARARVVSKREEFIYGSAPEVLDGYSTIDLYGEYKFDARMRVYVDLQNLANTRYVDIRGYNTRRFNYLVGVRFQF